MAVSGQTNLAHKDTSFGLCLLTQPRPLLQVMIIKMNRILLVLLVMLLVACSESFTIQLEPEVSVFLSHDRSKNISLTPEDEEYVSLNEWLRINNSGWHSTSGRYPGGVYIMSGDYGIQVTDLFVIIYSTSSDEPKALYIQKLDKSELVGIKNMGK
jgi:hypothetical protein